MPSKTLIIGLNWLGDVVMSFPAISSAAVTGRERVDVLSRPNLSSIYRLNQGVGKVWSVDTKTSLLNNLSLIGKIRRCRYKRIIVFPRSFRAASIAFLCGGESRIGYSAEGRDALLHSCPDLPPDFRERHESSLYLDLVMHAGMDVNRDWSIAVPEPKDIQEVSRLFDLEKKKPFVVFAPGAAFGPAKMWGVEKFAELARRISCELGWNIVVTGVGGENEITAAVAGACGNKGTNLGGKTSLLQLSAILSLSKGLVANDSGTMHLAAILEKPVVIPIGSTDPRRTGPLTKKAGLVKGTSCGNICRSRTCSRPDHLCMTSISVESMFNAVIQVM